MTILAEAVGVDLGAGFGLTTIAGAIIGSVKLLIDWSERRSIRRQEEADKQRQWEDRRRHEEDENARQMALLLREMVTAMVKSESTLSRAVDAMTNHSRRGPKADRQPGEKPPAAG